MTVKSKSKIKSSKILSNDVAINGWVLDKNGKQIKDIHRHDKILGAWEVLISLYDIALNETKIKDLQSFIWEIEELIE